jgi:UDP-N-acetylglucosamine acyltransferase
VSIHCTAIVSPGAKLGTNVHVGPFTIVEPGAVVADNCRLASHVVIKSGVTLGRGTLVFEGAVLGGLPQHVKLPENPGRLVLGDGNVIREHCTLHRSLQPEGVTRLGNNNVLMVGAHVAHDCVVGNNVVMANNVLLAGHVTVGDRAFFGGAAAVHQFCRIGQLAMIGGHARVTQDVPPYVTVDGGSSMIVGLNRVGLSRSGYTSDEIAQLKEAYKLIYRQGLKWREVLEALRVEFPAGPAADYAVFLSGGTRGFLAERRPPRAATIKLHRDEPAQPEYQSKAS